MTDRWKTAWRASSVKDDYSLAKSCGCISLLNCLYKVVETVVAMLVSAHCEATGGLPPGPIRLQGLALGGRKQDSLARRPHTSISLTPSCSSGSSSTSISSPAPGADWLVERALLHPPCDVAGRTATPTL